MILRLNSQGIDYFENLCLQTETTCADQRTFSPPRVSVIVIVNIVIIFLSNIIILMIVVMILTVQVGVPDSKIALHVNVHFYTDKVICHFNGNIQ